MTSTSDGRRTPDGNIVELRAELIVAPPPKPRPPSRLHGSAIAGMALFALMGIVSLLALITVRWPGDSNRFVTGLFIASGIGLLLCCCLAVFSAARDTYARNGGTEKEQE